MLQSMVGGRWCQHSARGTQQQQIDHRVSSTIDLADGIATTMQQRAALNASDGMQQQQKAEAAARQNLQMV